MPGNAGSHSEFLHQKVMASLHVVDEIVKVRAGLITHAPASIQELQTSIFHKLAHLSFESLWLFIPPQREELHLYITEPFLGILEQLMNDILQDQFDVSPLDNIARSREVLVRGLQPSNIIMSMRHDMDCKWGSTCALCFKMLFIVVFRRAMAMR